MKFGPFLSFAALVVLGVAPAFAEETTAAQATTDEAPVAVSDFAPATVEEGLQQIDTYLRDQSEDAAPIKDRLQQGVKMLDQIWLLDSDLELKRKVIWTRFSIRMGLAGMGDESSIEALAAELKKASQHADPEVAAEGANAGLSLEMILLRQKSPAERLAVIKEKAKEVEALPIGPLSTALAMTLVKNVDIIKDREQATLITNSLASHFAKSDDPKVQKMVENMQGYARRMNLKGNAMQVVGKKLDGEDIQWGSFKGKVVLVDFWATWCGPCIGEFPHMKEMYEIYHKHGFEIIGISLDDTKPIVEEFVTAREIPWIILCNAEGDDYKGFSDENARYYGINAIPQMIFVGKDGLVIDTEARGERLAELLAEAFPDVEVPTEATHPTGTTVVTE